jgi:hypothetical protein
VHVTAFPEQDTLRVAVAGDLDTGSADGLATLIAQLSTDMVSTLVVDLAEARLPNGVPRTFVEAMRHVQAGQRVGRCVLVNVPPGVARSARADPRLLWHERHLDPVVWQDALRLAKPAAQAGTCDCSPAERPIARRPRADRHPRSRLRSRP